MVGEKLARIGLCQVVPPDDLTLFLWRTANLCPSLPEPNSAFVMVAGANFHHGYRSDILARLESREDRMGPGPGIGPRGRAAGNGDRESQRIW